MVGIKYHRNVNIWNIDAMQKILLALWQYRTPDSKVHGANTQPTWVLSFPGGPHVGPMNLAIWALLMEKVTTTPVNKWSPSIAYTKQYLR